MDVPAVCARMNMPLEMVADVWPKLAELDADGMIDIHNQMVQITQAGLPFVRVVASCFDAYFKPAENKHAQAV